MGRAGRHRAEVLTGHDDAVMAVAFSPDGSRIASAGADRSVRLWDTADPGRAVVLYGHTDQVLGSPSPPTAGPWPPVEPTGRCGCGTCRGVRRARCSPATATT
ncbi:WD40 repeat domain-containing protein [Streptomyces cirratus]